MPSSAFGDDVLSKAFAFYNSISDSPGITMADFFTGGAQLQAAMAEMGASL